MTILFSCAAEGVGSSRSTTNVVLCGALSAAMCKVEGAE